MSGKNNYSINSSTAVGTAAVNSRFLFCFVFKISLIIITILAANYIVLLLAY